MNKRINSHSHLSLGVHEPRDSGDFRHRFFYSEKNKLKKNKWIFPSQILRFLEVCVYIFNYEKCMNENEVG